MKYQIRIGLLHIHESAAQSKCKNLEAESCRGQAPRLRMPAPLAGGDVCLLHLLVSRLKCSAKFSLK